MLKLIVSDEFVDVVSNMPIMCMNKVFENIVAFDTVSLKEANEFRKTKLLEFYDHINNQKVEGIKYGISN